MDETWKQRLGDQRLTVLVAGDRQVAAPRLTWKIRGLPAGRQVRIEWAQQQPPGRPLLVYAKRNGNTGVNLARGIKKGAWSATVPGGGYKCEPAGFVVKLPHKQPMLITVRATHVPVVVSGFSGGFSNGFG